MNTYSRLVNWTPQLWFLGLLASTTTTLLAAEWDVLPLGENASPGNRVVYNHLARLSHDALRQRREQYETLQTPAEIKAYQQRLRDLFVQRLGGFPDRTPLNSRIVGKLDGDGYRIEKVIFASQPHHHVTANLYLPKGTPPFPCVVVASGHSRTAKAADYNQRFGIIMAKNGMASLVYDPIGQGERSMILDQAGHAKHKSTTTEHFQIGVGSILLGTNTARYRVWDGMRAIDYAQSREDIDGSRIGFTGCSGGGTLTSYIMALDERVTCAAPACYLTTFGHLIDTIGPQDAEQNIFGQLAIGMDHPDYVLMRAPRPTIISCTTGDYFSADGAWDNFRQAKRIYTRLGYAERMNLVEGDGGHGVPLGNLNAIMRWMRRWLLHKDDGRWTDEFAIRQVNELQCTPEGQVLLLDDELSVYDLNATWQARLRDKRQQFQSLKPPEKRQQIRRLLGIPDKFPSRAISLAATETATHKDFAVEKRLYTAKHAIPLPTLVFRPKELTGNVIVYTSGKGKQAALEDETVATHLKQGNVVVAVDLPGTGETRDERGSATLGDWKNFYMSYLLGKSYVGLRAEAILLLTSQLRNEMPDRPIQIVASDETAIAALHAAALSDDFQRVELRDAIRSWVPIVGAVETKNQLVNTVHGVLAHYDLPDLVDMHGAVHHVASAQNEGK